MEVISPVPRVAALNRGMFFKDCFVLDGEPSVETPERNRWKPHKIARVSRWFDLANLAG